jgi:hypothetical protein
MKSRFWLLSNLMVVLVSISGCCHVEHQAVHYNQEASEDGIMEIYRGLIMELRNAKTSDSQQVIVDCMSIIKEWAYKWRKPLLDIDFVPFDKDMKMLKWNTISDSLETKSIWVMDLESPRVFDDFIFPVLSTNILLQIRFGLEKID